MPEQKGLAKFLKDEGAVTKFLAGFKTAIEERLIHLYLGLMQLKAAGYAVDAIQPQGAIFLSVWIEAKHGTAALMQFLLDECNIAMVPFSAFGAAGSEGWFRLSVGTVTTGDISSMLMKLQHGLLRQVKSVKVTG